MTPRRQGYWGPWTRTPSPGRLPGISELSPAPLEKRSLTHLLLPEEGVCRVDRQNGWGSPQSTDGGLRDQGEGALTFAPKGPVYHFAPSPLEISQRQLQSVNKNMKSPLFPIPLLPESHHHMLQGQQPWESCWLRPGHQLPRPPKPKTRA